MCMPLSWCCPVACRLDPMAGCMSLEGLASKMLFSHALVQNSQNQNAGFVAWFCLALLLHNNQEFGRASKQLHHKYAEFVKT